MQLLVISDTHGSCKAAQEQIITHEASIQGVIHLGDYTEDCAHLNRQFTGLSFYSVRGNNDYDDTPRTRILRLEGHVLALTHGHEFGVYRGTDSLYYWGLEQEADLVLFGHTHVPYLEFQGKVGLMNPGSICCPRNLEGPSYGLLTLERDKAIRAEIFCMETGTSYRLLYKNY